MRKLQIKFPSQIRISGWDFGSSARAMNQAGGKDSLMTYESVSKTQADLEKVSRSTTERKIMSTKTSIKRIALVAVAALGIAGFTGVAANAAGNDKITVTQAVSYSAESKSATATGVVGGQVSFDYATSTTDDHFITTDAGGHFVNVGSATGANQPDFTNGYDSTAGLKWTPSSDVRVLTVHVTASAVGTEVVSIKTIDGTTGVPTTIAKLTITWGTSAGTGLNAANSLIYLANSGTGCADFTTSASHAADVAIANGDTNAITSAYKTDDVDVCIVTRDANGNKIPVTTASTIYGSWGVNDFASASSIQDITLSNANGISGAQTVTAVLIDNAGNVISLTSPITFYGTLATLKIANKNYASLDGGAATYGASTSGKGYIKVYGYDAAGNQIELKDHANGTNVFTIESDATAGTAADRSSDSAGATVDTSTFANTDLFNYGYNRATVSCVASVKAEHLTITAWGQDATGAWVKSNSIDYYCSDNAVAKGKITVKPSADTVDAGGAITANINYVDSNGYPVPDYTGVTMSVSNGAGVNTPSTSTLNGAFYYPANIVAGTNGPISILAVGVLNASGLASVTVNGSQTSDAIDAANEATDAANAATDAANAAAEAADAATSAANDALSAAQDASAKVDALATQVASLVASIKAQITTLTNLVIKIQKKVKA